MGITGLKFPMKNFLPVKTLIRVLCQDPHLKGIKSAWWRNTKPNLIFHWLKIFQFFVDLGTHEISPKIV